MQAHTLDQVVVRAVHVPVDCTVKRGVKPEGAIMRLQCDSYEHLR